MKELYDYNDLHFAILRKDINKVKELLRYDEVINKSGLLTEDKVKILTENSKLINAPTMMGIYPLLMATLLNDVQTISVLISNLAKVQQTGFSESTEEITIHPRVKEACESLDPDFYPQILKQTALMIAVSKGCVDCVDALLKKFNVDLALEYKAKNGETALELAKALAEQEPLNFDRKKIVAAFAHRQLLLKAKDTAWYFETEGKKWGVNNKKKADMIEKAWINIINDKKLTDDTATIFTHQHGQTPSLAQSIAYSRFWPVKPTTQENFEKSMEKYKADLGIDSGTIVAIFQPKKQ
ncbi:MAG: ankyrin repeat domain-containing protein [Gammaproteobacteria bacterium]